MSNENTPRTGPAKFFATVRSLDVVRAEDRWFAGVCGGVAARLGLDPLLVRGVLAALTAVGGLGLALYGLAWLLVPDGRPGAGGRIEAEAALRGDVSGAVWLAGGLVVVDLAVPRSLVGIGSGGWSGPGWGFLVTTLVAAACWWLLHDRPFPRPFPPPFVPEGPPDPTADASQTRPISLVKETAPARQPLPAPDAPGPAAGFGSPTERRAAARQDARAAREESRRMAAERARRRRRPGSPLLTTAVLGLALLAAGSVVTAALVVDLPGRTAPLALSAALAVLGGGAVVAGLRSRRTALVGMAWPVAFCAVATALLPPATGWTWQTGQTWRPTAADGLSSAVGRLRVDPSGLVSGPATATIAAGRLEVVVPTQATVLVEVRVLAGSLRWQQSPDVVVVGPAAGRGTGGAAGTSGGVDLTELFAVGPDAAILARAVNTAGEDPADWTAPTGTPELQAVAWAGEVRLGAAGSSALEER